MANYTQSTRTVTKGMIGTAKTKKEIKTILCDGEWYADVPSDSDSEEVCRILNEQEAEKEAYRAQFDTEEAWLQNFDENAE